MEVLDRVAGRDHIFEKVSPAMEALGLECQCLGGGKIEHSSTDTKISVWRVNYHSVTIEMLKSVFGDYEVTWGLMYKACLRTKKLRKQLLTQTFGCTKTDLT
ncbi:phosphohistidine phosphatase [Merluccius polli]|uniref:Phosphohistidine phosphatase n=1 Tax=Merluccius polli TaxID=89951 RepID=A0AA47MWV4_MERPO|nr:phosphohistidine phosphatase [Merluccius polli]